jgi:hypothetical protein
MTDEQRIVSNALYDLAMTLTDQRVKHVDSLIERFCVLAGIPFPPEKGDE